MFYKIEFYIIYIYINNLLFGVYFQFKYGSNHGNHGYHGSIHGNMAVTMVTWQLP